MEPMKHADLWALREQGEWAALWEAAVPVVQLVANQLKRTGEAGSVDYDELIAEGNLAAGEAVRQWQPLDSTFDSWISLCVRNRLRTIVGQQRNRDRSRAEQDVEQLPSNVDVIEVAAIKEVQHLLERLQGLDRLLVQSFYGLNCEIRTVDQLAKDTGLHRNTVRRRIDAAIESLSA